MKVEARGKWPYPLAFISDTARVSQAVLSSPRTQIWACLKRESLRNRFCSSHDTHVVHIRYTPGTHSRHTWYTFDTRGAHPIHTRYTFDTHVVHIRYTRGTHSIHTWYTFDTHVVHIRYTRGTHSIHLETCWIFLVTSGAFLAGFSNR